MTSGSTIERGSDVVDVADLREVTAGTGVVRGVDVGVSHTVLDLEYPFGHRVRLCVPVAPRTADYERPMSGARVLAVRLTCDRSGVRCTVLGTSAGGSARFEVSLGQALALVDTGVHAVVTAS